MLLFFFFGLKWLMAGWSLTKNLYTNLNGDFLLENNTISYFQLLEKVFDLNLRKKESAFNL
jgi:hypothetical protein